MGLYAGGTDTVSIHRVEKSMQITYLYSIKSFHSQKTVSTIYAFFMAMQLYPNIQTKAQAEIDSVLGSDRMPSIADRPRLPYVDAVVKELLRWNSVVPLGTFTNGDDFHHSSVGRNTSCGKGRRCV